MIKISEDILRATVEVLVHKIIDHPQHKISSIGLYFVPNAGYKVAELIAKRVDFKTTFSPWHPATTMIIDDIIDSGETFKRYKKYGLPFLALYSKNRKYDKHAIRKVPSTEWVQIFGGDKGIESNITRILQYIGEDVNREGLLKTPERVAKSFDKLYGGYKENPADILKTTFSEKYDEMVILKDCEFYSTCEHHMLPFHGKIHIGYIPINHVVGISKLARLVEVYARRLQIQERMVNQIAGDIKKYLKPAGVMVTAEAQHFCMTSRGVEKQSSIMVTSSVKGMFKTNSNTRQEFLKLMGR